MSKPLKSPSTRLLAGLAITLAAVAVFSWYALQQSSHLRDLQTQTVDRNRKDSLQLLRIQNDLHSLGFAMRDMLNGDEPYPLEAWKGQFDRTRADLNDGLRLESQFASAARSPARQAYFSTSLAQLWVSAGEMFAMARAGRQKEARDLVRTTLESQQAAIAASVARLLVENNESEEQAVARIQAIYRGVERNVYLFLAAMLLAISLTSLYLIHFNRRLFENLALLSSQRSDLARKLITMQEEVLRSISRELHDEFGQILTAMGAMLSRASKQNLPPAFQADLGEIRDVAQSALEKTRSLSLALHPSILDEGGLEQAIDWYVPVFEKQTGILVKYEKDGKSPMIADAIGIHVYRVLQEALNNVARHSKSDRAFVRVQFREASLCLEIEDHGAGISHNGRGPARRGIGMVAMRERAELLNATLEFAVPPSGGTIVRLNVSLVEEINNGQ